MHRLSSLKVWVCVLLSVFVQVGSIRAAEVAAQIYQKASPGVFVILLRDANGLPVSFGTGFLIAKNTLVTNFHVVEGGAVYLSQGSLSIPTRVEKTDPVNDLAILHIDADIDASPLPLSSVKAVPGESVFAIGNPEGSGKSGRK